MYIFACKMSPLKPNQCHALSVLSWYRIYNNTFNTLKHSVDILISVNVLPRLLVKLRDLLDIGLVISDAGVNR